ncbi:hypothetical protein JB92DRAFT_2990416, partial [Gautieria morchelliformis]
MVDAVVQFLFMMLMMTVVNPNQVWSTMLRPDQLAQSVAYPVTEIGIMYLSGGLKDVSPVSLMVIICLRLAYRRPFHRLADLALALSLTQHYVSVQV